MSKRAFGHRRDLVKLVTGGCQADLRGFDLRQNGKDACSVWGKQPLKLTRSAKTSYSAALIQGNSQAGSRQDRRLELGGGFEDVRSQSCS